MKKLITIGAVLWIVFLTYAGADECYIPLTVDEIPIKVEPLPLPEYTLCYEGGRCVVESDWFVKLQGSWVRIITYDIINNTEFVFECNYLPSRGAFVSDTIVDEKPVSSMEWYTFTGEGLSFYATMYFDDIGLSDAGIMAIVDGFEDNIWYEYSWGADGVLHVWVDHYGATVFFDDLGNTTGYMYRSMDDVEYLYTEYSIDGTLLSVDFMVSDAEYFYEYDPASDMETWRDYRSEIIDPPKGYDRNRLYELFPPLVIVQQKTTGDVNDDGKVDMNDIVELIWYLSDASTSVVTGDADVNSDGAVDTYDVLHIMQYFAEWKELSE